MGRKWQKRNAGSNIELEKPRKSQTSKCLELDQSHQRSQMLLEAKNKLILKLEDHIRDLKAQLENSEQVNSNALITMNHHPSREQLEILEFYREKIAALEAELEDLQNQVIEKKGLLPNFLKSKSAEEDHSEDSAGIMRDSWEHDEKTLSEQPIWQSYTFLKDVYQTGAESSMSESEDEQSHRHRSSAMSRFPTMRDNIQVPHLESVAEEDPSLLETEGGSVVESMIFHDGTEAEERIWIPPLITPRAEFTRNPNSSMTCREPP